MAQGGSAFHIAVYGKGGIGKSTISANLSAALAKMDKKVLQIGCDPKHDSTRLLLHGRAPRTVLDYMKEVPPQGRTLHDVVQEGYGGVVCVESGGPEPGVGCAGRGILSTFDLLEEVGLVHDDFDVVIYDVLGDVVCGGFAVPLRQEHADSVFLVTSGEYMAIYAANNILRGIKNHDGPSPRVAGILFNSRGLETEGELVRNFARATGLPIIMILPRSESFALAERDGMTIVESSPEGELGQSFLSLAKHVCRMSEGKIPLNPACPLTDVQLESLLRGTPFTPSPAQNSRPTPVSSCVAVHRHTTRAFKSRSVMKGDVLYGCAFAGVVPATVQVKDAMTIAHGPRSCSHIAFHFLSSSMVSTQKRQGAFDLSAAPLPLCSTDLDDIAFIYGGMQELQRKLEEVAGDGPKAMFVVTTCPAGLIGDDVKAIAQRVEHGHPGLRVIPVLTDGNMTGDFSQGLIEGAMAIAELIDPSVTEEDGYVNLVGQKNLASNRMTNHRIMSELLEGLGLRINCSFINDSSVDAVRSFKRARLNILAQTDDQSIAIRDFLIDRFGCLFLDRPFPIGFLETVEWLRAIGERVGAEERAERSVHAASLRYEEELRPLSDALSGKRAMIVSHNSRVDWVLDLLSDLGMVVVRVGLMSGPDDGLPIRHRDIPVKYLYTKKDRTRDLLELRPDIVLSNYLPYSNEGTSHNEILPLCPDVGFWTGVEMAKRWTRIIKLPPLEGWRRDGGEA